MTINFYQLRRERRNKINKNLTSVGGDIHIVVDGNLRDSINVSDIDIVIDISETSNIDAVAPTEAIKESVIQTFRNNPYAFNYVYIPDLKRYYFVKSINLLRKNILSFELHVDVLSTFYSFIYYQKAFVSRNKTNYNIELPDERRIVTNENDIIYHTLIDTKSPDEYVKFDAGFSSYERPREPHNIVAMISNNLITESQLRGGTERISPPVDTDLPSVFIHTFIPSITLNYLLNETYFGMILNFIRIHSNYESFLIQAYAFPFDFQYIKPFNTKWNNPAYMKDIMLGDAYVEELPRTLQNVTSEMTSTYLLNTSFVLPDNISDFNDLEPYSKYELYIPYYGYYELDYNSLKGHELYLYYIVSLTDGSATVILYDNTEDMIVTSLKCQLGIELSKSASNVTEVRNRHDANNTSLVLGVIASILSVVGGIATGGAGAVLGVAGGALAGAKTIGSYVASEKSNLLQHGNINFNGNTAPLFAPQTAFIRQTKRKIQYQLTTDFLEQNGGVLNELVLLRDLQNTGYTEIADIPNILYPSTGDIPTDKEIDEIMSLLKSGVIF